MDNIFLSAKMSIEDDNPKTQILKQFLVDLPKDFYQFWDFCRSLKPENPSGMCRGGEALIRFVLIIRTAFDIFCNHCSGSESCTGAGVSGTL